MGQTLREDPARGEAVGGGAEGEGRRRGRASVHRVSAGWRDEGARSPPSRGFPQASRAGCHGAGGASDLGLQKRSPPPVAAAAALGPGW